ncbi:hypothetical protein [Streptomyces decoyicus]|uniref:hypothetical protein n=1 Tax=Streptomyces decoyicus TaxID=249567 RepID=UPI0033A1B03D
MPDHAGDARGPAERLTAVAPAAVRFYRRSFLFFDAEAPPGGLLPEGDEEFAAETVRALLDGLAPSGGA